MSDVLDEEERRLVWKTGMRVPVTGIYVDQYGYRSTHKAHRTFPPCIGVKGECAHRVLVKVIND